MARQANSRHECAAICTPGLEPVCEAELRALGLRARTVSAGVIEFKATPRQLYSSTLWLRTASRVLVRITKFRATDFNYLETRCREIEWDRWLPTGHVPEFRITSHKSRLFHTEAIAERMQNIALGGADLEDFRTGAPRQPFVVRVDHDLFTVSADAAGTPLNQRAWRTELGVAPLRTTMAAGLLMASGWDGSTPLLDPFCGSGTIAIEAALLARGVPPGGDRDFAFSRWADFEPGTWASVMGEVVSKKRDGIEVTIEAADRDEAAVEVTRANAKRAGVLDDIDIQVRVVSHLQGRDDVGLVATNPPYGKRVGAGDLRPLYRRFGAVLRERRPRWELAMVAADQRLAHEVDKRLKPLGGYGHGGIRVQMYHRAGSDLGEVASHREDALEEAVIFDDEASQKMPDPETPTDPTAQPPETTN
jgi:putative N6-adenine-specific DNA methylase